MASRGARDPVRAHFEGGLRAIRVFLWLGLMWLALAPFARAAEDTPRETLDAVKTTLADIDDELKLDTLSDGELAALRARTEPLGGELQTVIARPFAAARSLAQAPHRAETQGFRRPGAIRPRRRRTQVRADPVRQARRRPALRPRRAASGRRLCRADQQPPARDLHQADLRALLQRAEPGAVGGGGARDPRRRPRLPRPRRRRRRGAWRRAPASARSAASSASASACWRWRCRSAGSRGG